jgi:hypothetical protein
VNPAPYSKTNTAELEAIKIFTGLLPSAFIKHDVKFNDKTPNTDGQLEIVDEKQYPVGKIEVQIKAIPSGATSFQCPIESIAYSEKISIPFILVCVDITNRKAYFRHLNRQILPQLPPDQKTFVLKFDPKIHAISDETQYIRQWTAIIGEYQKRISDYPRASQIANQIDLNRISIEDRVYFQQFIEHANQLLDMKFPCVKEQFFNGVWKLGVAVSSADKERVAYQLFTIQPGEPDIRVVGTAMDLVMPSFGPDPSKVTSAWISAPPGGKEFQYHWTIRSALKSPIEEASALLYAYLEKMLEAKSFPLRGERLSVEYLFWFVDNFGQSIGIDAGDRLKVPDLSYGIKVYFPAWASVAVPRWLGEVLRLNRANPFAVAHIICRPPFESITGVYPLALRPTREEVIAAINSGIVRARRMTFHEVSPALLVGAVDVLTELGIESIERPYLPRTKPNPSTVFSGYDQNAMRHNALKIVKDAASGYRQFVEQNSIYIKQSTWIQGPVSVIHVADFSEWEAQIERGGSPHWKYYHVKNNDHQFSNLDAIERDQISITSYGGKKFLRIGDAEREIIGEGGGLADDVFKKLPALNMVYEMLQEDLKRELRSVAGAS